MFTTQVNPMRELMRQEMGLDTFSIDMEESPIRESWDAKNKPCPNQFKWS